MKRNPINRQPENARRSRPHVSAFDAAGFQQGRGERHPLPPSLVRSMGHRTPIAAMAHDLRAVRHPGNAGSDKRPELFARRHTSFVRRMSPQWAQPRIRGPPGAVAASGVLRSPARRSKRGRERGPASGFSAVKLPSVARKHPSPQCGATGAARLDPLPRWRRQAVRKRLVQWPVGSAMQSKRSNPGLRPGLPHASLPHERRVTRNKPASIYAAAPRSSHDRSIIARCSLSARRPCGQARQATAAR